MRPRDLRPVLGFIIGAVCLPAAGVDAAPRARELGIPFQGTPGLLDAITDVAGIEVGQKTLICAPPACGHGVRTGVTIVHPLGRAGRGAVAAGFATINGTASSPARICSTNWACSSGR